MRFYCPETDFEEMKLLRTNILALIDIVRNSGPTGGTGALAGTASNDQGQLNAPSTYRVSRAGLSLRYPENWTVKEHPEKDTEVSISGANKKGQYADLRFAVPEIPPEMRLEDYVQLIDSELLKANKGMKILEETSNSFGRGNLLSGIQQVFSLDINGIPSVQVHAIFRHDGRTCWVNMTCPGWTLSEAKESFAKVLSSLEER